MAVQETLQAMELIPGKYCEKLSSMDPSTFYILLL
jgi:hypothetical protein